jgi:signal transduction histidine kinase
MNSGTDSMPHPTRISELRDRIATHRVLREVPAFLVGIVAPTFAFSFNIDNQKAVGGGGIRNVIAIAMFVPLLLLRRRWPTQAVAIGAIASAGITAATGARTAALPSMIVLLFAMSARQPRRTSLAFGGIAVALVFGAAAANLDGHRFTPDSFGILAWSCLALAAGDAVRSGRLYVESLQERSRHLEANQEIETKQRVVEERLRIARELHDVVAHNMAIVNVQAGVASYLVREDPAAAEAALAVVRDAGRSILDELSDILSVLRGTDNDSDELLTEHPQPTLRELDPLVASFRAVGLHVTHHVCGLPTIMPKTVQLTAYRIVEEALTNAHKHGDGHAEFHVDYTADAIELTVTNRIRSLERTMPETLSSGTATRPGFGLTGIGERVASARGTLVAGPSTGGTYVLNVRIPIDRADKS